MPDDHPSSSTLLQLTPLPFLHLNLRSPHPVNSSDPNAHLADAETFPSKIYSVELHVDPSPRAIAVSEPLRRCAGTATPSFLEFRKPAARFPAIGVGEEKRAGNQAAAKNPIDA
jgi:hypothetical protein